MTSITTALVLIVLIQSVCSTATAFVPNRSTTEARQTSPRTAATTKFSPLPLRASPLGDAFAGITGVAPSSLELPSGVLEGTFLDPSREGVDLERVYKASKDGWSAINFHQCVDDRGSAVVVALSKSGKRFGAYNPLGWMSSDDYGNSNAAFLWFEKGGRVEKCPALTGGNAAVFDYASGGPCFGAADLQIGPPRAAVMGGFAGPDMENSEMTAGDLRKCKSSVGGAFNIVKGWPVGGEFEVVEVEVYLNGNVRKSGGGGGGIASFFKF